MLISASLWLSNTMSQLFLIIDSALYSAIAWLYELFLVIAQSKIFADSMYENFSQRIYIVLGIVMLFVLAYTLLTVIINPDNFNKGDSSFSKIAFKLVTSLVIIGLLPTIFSYAYNLQDYLLEKNVLGTLLFGNNEQTYIVREQDESGNYTEREEVFTSIDQIENYGNVMAFTALNAFLNPENVNFEYDASDFSVQEGLSNAVGLGAITCGITTIGSIVVTIVSSGVGGLTLPSVATFCAIGAGTGGLSGYLGTVVSADVEHYTWANIQSEILINRNFSVIQSLAGVLKEGAKEVSTGNSIAISYSPFISSLCAVILIYLLVSFCLDLGIRAIRLAFLQLIAPIPIFMRAMPGKGQQFDKWLKKTIATYLEVFIRVFLMYMAVFFLSNLEIDTSSQGGLWMKVILIMGVIAFVKEAPKLIADITGIDSGNMKLGIMPKLAAGGALAGAAMLGGGVKTGIQNLTHGASNTVQAWKDGHRWTAIGRGVRTLFSTGSGLVSGAGQSLYAGRGAKNLADARKAASSGAKAAIDARDKREAYRISHKDDTIKMFGKDVRMGTFGAHITDLTDNALNFIGLGNNAGRDARVKEAASAIKSSISAMQDVWKNDEGWKKADEEVSRRKGEIFKYGNYDAYLKFVADKKQEYIDRNGGSDAGWNAHYNSMKDRYALASGVSGFDLRNFFNAINAYDVADSSVKGIEKAIQSKKASQLAGMAKTVATYVEKYSDVMPEVLSGLPDEKDLVSKLKSLDLANATSKDLNDKLYSTLNTVKISAAETSSAIDRRNILRSKSEEKK